MPIYSYRCDNCGHQQDVLQKMSDPLLVTCPACGQATYRKQVTAAGFQLKGSGWYVTDFRNPATKEAAKEGAKGASEGDAGGAKDSGKPAEAASANDTGAKPADTSAAKVDATPATPATKPAAGSGAGGTS